MALEAVSLLRRFYEQGNPNGMNLIAQLQPYMMHMGTWTGILWNEWKAIFFECLLVIIMTKPTLESEMTSTLHTLLAIIIWLYDAYCSHDLLHALMLAIPWTVKICKKLLKMMYFHLISPLGREITTGTPTHPPMHHYYIEVSFSIMQCTFINPTCRMGGDASTLFAYVYSPTSIIC
jgi:hypothetical protein